MKKRSLKKLALMLVLALVLPLFAGCSLIGFDFDFGELGELGENIGNPLNPFQQQAQDSPMTGEEISEYAKTRVGTVYVHDGAFSSDSTGSGFFIDDKGTFVTNYHVMAFADSISVEMDDGGNYAVEKIIDFSEKYDLAILKVAISKNDYFETSEAVTQGEQVYAIGSALGTYTGTMTSGIVSNTSRTFGAIDCIQMDAAISHGNSGGPLVNSYGKVVGINSYSVSNGNDLNLAININMLDCLDNNRNFTVSDYVEWWRTEISRSYRPTNINDETRYTYSIINTYQSYTGRECLVSMNSLDYKDGDGITSGYDSNYSVYVYKYSKDEYDTYVQYMKEMGFEYKPSLSDEYYDGTLSTYHNPANGMVMLLYVTNDKHILGDNYIQIQTLY